MNNQEGTIAPDDGTRARRTVRGVAHARPAEGDPRRRYPRSRILLVGVVAAVLAACSSMNEQATVATESEELVVTGGYIKGWRRVSG